MKFIDHAGAPASASHYSAAVRDGNHLYISGQLPLDPATREFCRGDAREQTLQALKNMENLIRQEGGDRSCVVRTTAYVADMKLWDEVNSTYREFFGEHRPARTIVAVPEVHFGFLVEIDAIAVLPEKAVADPFESAVCVKSPYQQIETPALLIDRERMERNIRCMQEKPDRWGVNLRPHTKTHKIPTLAALQLQAGAAGIAVAKVGEAEVMAAHGINDIFIANEIVGASKWQRLAKLSKTCRILFGVDSPEAVYGIEKVFAENDALAIVRIEVETGENRSGVVSDEAFDVVLQAIAASPHVELEGVFSHEGHTYSAPTVEVCCELMEKAQRQTLHFARRAREAGFDIKTVSVGSTPSLLHGDTLLEGITEIRPGTYILMDAGQGNCIGSHEDCAATVLTTVISRPTAGRVIGDAGAKALTAQSRGAGLCHTAGKGIVKNSGGITVTNVYDEHTIFENKALHDMVEVGDKIEIIPNHICPVCNLYDKAWLVSGGQIVEELDVAARGKIV